MSRQHATPILLNPDGTATPLTPLSLLGGPEAVSEAAIQKILPKIGATRALLDFDDATQRADAFAWPRAKTNDFVNALRPRIRAKLQDLGL